MIGTDFSEFEAGTVYGPVEADSGPLDIRHYDERLGAYQRCCGDIVGEILIHPFRYVLHLCTNLFTNLFTTLFTTATQPVLHCLLCVCVSE